MLTSAKCKWNLLGPLAGTLLVEGVLVVAFHVLNKSKLEIKVKKVREPSLSEVAPTRSSDKSQAQTLNYSHLAPETARTLQAPQRSYFEVKSFISYSAEK